MVAIGPAGRRARSCRQDPHPAPLETAPLALDLIDTTPILSRTYADPAA
jgi:hypothetical protein